MMRGKKNVAYVFLLMFVISLTATMESAASDPEPPYIGIIKNKTGYDVSIPSDNSGATLVVPAQGWVEYIAWSPMFPLDAYYNGKPIWCDNVAVTPGKYQYKCKKYDFLAEIVKPEPEAGNSKPMKKRQRRVKKQPKV
jgi:hypothetical protein